MAFKAQDSSRDFLAPSIMIITICSSWSLQLEKCLPSSIPKPCNILRHHFIFPNFIFISTICFDIFLIPPVPPSPLSHHLNLLSLSLIQVFPFYSCAFDTFRPWIWRKNIRIWSFLTFLLWFFSTMTVFPYVVGCFFFMILFIYWKEKEWAQAEG